MVKYSYFSLTRTGKPKEEFTCYSDIACEYCVTRNSVAGKFYRAHKKNSNIITVNSVNIKQVKSVENDNNIKKL